MGNAAVYPGSFDPITHGHISIINRGLQVFGSVIVAVAQNPQKNNLFTVQERLDMIKQVL
ncbi:MAG: adenylyltransferase/cytidyltransferase family protein, partial [Pseudomonadota bacterium]